MIVDKINLENFFPEALAPLGSYLNLSDICHLSSTSKYFNSVVNHPEFLQNFYYNNLHQINKIYPLSKRNLVNLVIEKRALKTGILWKNRIISLKNSYKSASFLPFLLFGYLTLCGFFYLFFPFIKQLSGIQKDPTKKHSSEDELKDLALSLATLAVSIFFTAAFFLLLTKLSNAKVELPIQRIAERTEIGKCRMKLWGQGLYDISTL